MKKNTEAFFWGTFKSFLLFFLTTTADVPLIKAEQQNVDIHVNISNSQKKNTLFLTEHFKMSKIKAQWIFPGQMKVKYDVLIVITAWVFEWKLV